MPAPQVIRDLVARFHEHQDSYRAETYSEAQLRQEFLNPFFEALGWDIYNRQGYAEAYKDVVHEDTIKVGGATKAPDYCFRIGGARKFFVEAKKPAVHLSQDVAPAYQLRRYAWSAKLPLSILTDFEEWAVYDCRVRPEKNDAASKARTLYLTFEQYEERWDEIAAVFSREAVLKGAFDKYAESSKKKRGTAEVDAAFLAEIEEWRSQLARNLALRNPALSQRELNAAVQKTIDRIIFLRICEDRGIELYGRLQALQNGPHTYARLGELFRAADDRYNSGLFQFSAEKGRREVPEAWTLSLHLDDAVLKDILRQLYYPDSPYEFSVIGAEILGQVYEQFLGKVIRLTAGHQEFPQVFAHGGFDAVIGNPPYIRMQAMKAWAPVEVEFYKQHYHAARQGNYDIYVVFVERGLELLNPAGRLGFILPHKFFSAEYGAPLRTLLTAGRHLAHIVHFGAHQIFAAATTYTCLLFLSKARSPRCRLVQVENLDDWIKTGKGPRGDLLAEEINGVAWNIQLGPAARVMKRLAKAPVKLQDVARLFVGLQTDADDVFILDELKRQGGRALCVSRATGKSHWFEADHLKPFLKGSLDIRRYGFSGAAKRLIFPYRNTGTESLLISAEQYADQYPLTWAYLLENRPRLARRAKGTLGAAWYGYVYKKNHLRFEQPKILVPAIAARACFAWDEAGRYYFVGSGGGGGGGCGIVLPPETAWSPLYLLGLLNSALTTYWLKRTSSVFRGGYLALNRQYIEEIPLIPAQLASPTLSDRLVKLVEKMLAWHGQATARTAQEQTALARQIAATDAQIDRLVYELYGLTEDEIRIVEEAAPR